MQNEYPVGDDQFQDQTITRVDGDAERGWRVTFDSGGSFGCPATSPVVPVVGMMTRQYGADIGSIVRGFFIDGRKVYYRTEAEQRQKNAEDAAAHDQAERERFERNRADLDKRYDALPAIFRKRLDKFRANNPDFRWQFEGYEMFTCEQAVVMANALKTPAEVRRFHGLTLDEQMELVPGLSDGHSGNTFGMSCRLALDFLEHPENVEKRHGALAVLVGSEEYGCVPKASSEVQALSAAIVAGKEHGNG